MNPCNTRPAAFVVGLGLAVSLAASASRQEPLERFDPAPQQLGKTYPEGFVCGLYRSQTTGQFMEGCIKKQPDSKTDMNVNVLPGYHVDKNKKVFATPVTKSSFVKTLEPTNRRDVEQAQLAFQEEKMQDGKSLMATYERCAKLDKKIKGKPICLSFGGNPNAPGQNEYRDFLHRKDPK